MLSAEEKAVLIKRCAVKDKEKFITGSECYSISCVYLNRLIELSPSERNPLCMNGD